MAKRRTQSSSSDRSNEPSSAPLVDSAVQEDERSYPSEQVRMRAYEIYLERGENVGDEVTDWVRAEEEFLERSRHGLADRESNQEGTNQDRP